MATRRAKMRRQTRRQAGSSPESMSIAFKVFLIAAFGFIFSLVVSSSCTTDVCVRGGTALTCPLQRLRCAHR